MRQKNIIFLDIDGVLNCQLFFKKHYKETKKEISKQVKSKEIYRLDYYKSQICPERMDLLNNLCKETDSVVVISSTWRKGKTVEELKEILSYCGSTFEIIDKTEITGYERGTEISLWLKNNIKLDFGDYSLFRRYVIIDDDSDMLLNQKNNFFQTDNYSGLTPNTCYKIKRFFDSFNL